MTDEEKITTIVENFDIDEMTAAQIVRVLNLAELDHLEKQLK